MFAQDDTKLNKCTFIYTKKLFWLILNEQFLIMVSSFIISFGVLFIPHVFSLKVLSFEKLNFAEERNNLSSFSLKFEIEQVCKDTFTYFYLSMWTFQLPDQFIICSSQHTAAPDDSYVYFLYNGEEQDLITLRYQPDSHNIVICQTM